MSTQELKRSDRYQIGVNYDKQREDKLKKFVSIIGSNVAQFTAEALDNEIHARLEAMREDERKAVEHLLQKLSAI